MVAVGVSLRADVLGVCAPGFAGTWPGARSLAGCPPPHFLSSPSSRGLRPPTGPGAADNVTMEQRAFVAVVLMAAVLILYQAFLVPSHEPVVPTQKAGEQAATEPAKTPAPTSVPNAAAVAPALPIPMPPLAEARPPQRITKVTTPLYDAGISSEGGKLQEFVLRYRGEKPMVAVGEIGPTGLVIAPVRDSSGQVLPMRPSADSLTLGPDQPSKDLVLTGGIGGLRVTETLTFRADAYTIDTRIRVENTGSSPQAVTVALPWS